MTNGLSHLIPVINILLDRSVIGLPTFSVVSLVTLICLSMNAVRTRTVTSVMEATAPFSSSVSILDRVSVLRTRIVTTTMESVMFLLPMTLTTVPTVLKEELVWEDVELWMMTRTVLMAISVMRTLISVNKESVTQMTSARDMTRSVMQTMTIVSTVEEMIVAPTMDVVKVCFVFHFSLDVTKYIYHRLPRQCSEL